MKHMSLRPAQRAVLLTTLMISMILSAACNPNPTATPPVLPTASATTVPTATSIPPTATPLPPRLNLPYTPVPLSVLSPIVVQHTPETGERLSPDGSIALVFDRAMDQKSVESAFQLQPAVSGKVEWSDARTFLFKPASPLPRNTVVDVALGQAARAADGAVLRAPYQFRFITQGNLEVGQTIPASDAREVDPETIITVLFNRPVVPLTTLNEQAGLPQPLSFTPALEGQAEWLNTSILVFRPARPLPGGVAFTGHIAASLKDTDGNPLAGDYTWSFSTAAPKVVWVTPDPKGQPARIDTAITIQYNQDIDPASAQTAFALLDTQGQTLQGQIVVLSNTLTFTPANRLAFDGTYNIRVAPGVKSSSGGNGSQETWNSTFRTVPLPKVIGTEPANGARDVYPGAPFTIRFNTDIEPATVMPHISFTPPLSLAKVYSYYNTYDHAFVLYFGSEPASDYVVQITPGISDPYGNLTEQSLKVA